MTAAGCAAIREEPKGADIRTSVRPIIFDSTGATAMLASLAAGSAAEQALAAAGRRRLERLVAREDEMTGWVLPLLRSYLPARSPLSTRVYLGAQLPEPLSVHDDAVFVDIASPVFGDADEALWNGIVRALYRDGLKRALAAASSLPSAPAATSAAKEDFTTTLLARLQLEGLVDHVASQGRPDAATPQAYRALEDRGVASERFMVVDDAFRDLRAGQSAAHVGKELDSVDARVNLYGIVGGAMALAIDRELGREALVDTITKGPLAFYSSYQRTSPGALVNFRLPVDPAAVVY